jgi:imidazoleglycerol-phosphate dehydratase
MERKIQFERKTKETNIKLNLNIDGRGKSEIETKIPFFNHLLSQIAVHGSFDLEIIAEDCNNIDNHHIIEDVAILLGEACNNALGNKKGISRVGHCFFPMDETLAFVAIDLSSRPYFVKDIEWTNPFLGSKEDSLIPVDLIEHFLHSFAINARITLHIRVLYGKNNHHIAEAMFKALGKALDYASRLDPKREQRLPSSKGIL